MRLRDQFKKVGVVSPTISKAAGQQLRFVRKMDDLAVTGVYALFDEDGTCVYVGESNRPIAERMKLSVSPGQGLYDKLAKWEGRPLDVMLCTSGETVQNLIQRLEPATNRPAAAIKVKPLPKSAAKPKSARIAAATPKPKTKPAVKAPRVAKKANKASDANADSKEAA